jgi:hypothetical protein
VDKWKASSIIEMPEADINNTGMIDLGKSLLTSSIISKKS